MPNTSYYPVFEPDQVLTDEHLNAMFAYLDQQDHLTRNKLLGIGIACGLHTSWDGNSINITKGVGISSLGYLLQFEANEFTHYRNYALPDFPDTISPSIHSYYKGLSMLQLVAADTPKQAGDKALANEKVLLRTHAVVLFIEPMLTDLKNCTTQDCNDRGKRVDITVRAMLVPKEQLSAYKYFGLQQQKFNFPKVHLKRWNVPAQSLVHPVDVIEAFDNILEPKLMKELADACSFVHDVFGPLFSNGNNDDALQQVYIHLTQLASTIRKNNTVQYQYVYDYVDDLIKAYHEFSSKVFDVLSECCPDENLFPLHLMLGDADGNSAANNTAYRHYFLYSSLFNQQRALHEEARMLYRRLVLMLEQFQLPNAAGLANRKDALPIRITPSYLGEFPLGKRCIPYYYKPDPLYSYWDYQKTRRGLDNLNYGYFAEDWSNDLAVQNPLLYDTEAYNFFRIEGHSGMPVATALRNLAAQKLNASLPVDIVAVNVYAGNDLAETDKLNCYFADLESHYNILLAEMLCKLHGVFCAAGKFPFNEKIFEAIFSNRNTIAGFKKGSTFTSDFASTLKSDTFKEKVAADAAAETGDDTTMEETLTSLNLGKSFAASFFGAQQALQTAALGFVDKQRGKLPYVKGSYLLAFCKPDTTKPTIASFYINWAKANPGKRWPKPQPLPAGEMDMTKWMFTAYIHLFYLIDTIEELVGKVIPYDLNELNYSSFKSAYDETMEAIEEYADYFDNLYHAMDLVNDQKDINAQKPFNLIQEEFEDWIIDKVVTKIVADSRGLIMMCVDDRIEQLLFEYRKRLKYVLEQLVLANYARQKTGLEHKAGVPKGGTFVMLYYRSPRTVKNEIAGNRFIRGFADAAKTETTAAELKEVLPEKELSFRKAAAEKLSLDESITQIQKAIGVNKTEFAAAQLKEIEALLDKVKALPAATETLRIPEGVVFADLYIPYMCCSDCAPTAFIFADKPDEEPQPDISMGRTFFCNNENVQELITASPEGCTVSGQGVTNTNGVFTFNPFGLNEGEYVLTGKLGTKTDTITVTVKATLSTDFNFNIKGRDPATGGIIVEFAAVAQNGQHLWDFGDNTATSTQVNPLHVYQFNGNSIEFNVTHNVTNGNCALPASTKLVTLKQQIDVTLDIKRQQFCSNDNPERLFYGPDGGTMTCKEAPQAIVSINNVFHFAPAASGPGKYTIQYTVSGVMKQIGVEVSLAPKAAFEARITDSNVDAVFIQFVPETKDGKHLWEFSDGQKSEEVIPAIMFKRNPNSPVESISATHTVTAGPCSDVIKKNVPLPGANRIEERRMAVCYTQGQQIALEPNLSAADTFTPGDAGIHKLDKKGMLALSSKTPTGLSNVVVTYKLQSGGSVTEKQVTISINRLDERIRLTFGAAGLQMEAATPSVVWKVSVNTSSGQLKTITENRTENPLVLKRRSEAPLKVEIGLIIEATISDRRCKQTLVHTIPAAQYNQLMEAGGNLVL